MCVWRPCVVLVVLSRFSLLLPLSWRHNHISSSMGITLIYTLRSLRCGTTPEFSNPSKKRSLLTSCRISTLVRFGCKNNKKRNGNVPLCKLLVNGVRLSNKRRPHLRGQKRNMQLHCRSKSQAMKGKNLRN